MKVNYVDVKSGTIDGWVDYSTVVDAYDNYDKSKMGQFISLDKTVSQRFAKKIQSVASVQHYDPLFVASLDNIFVNNIGNLVTSSERGSSQTEIIDSDQQSTNYLAQAKPVNDPTKPTIHIAEAFPILRPGDHIYGHWLIDILPRLWLLSHTRNLHTVPVVIRHNAPKFVDALLGVIGISGENVIRFDFNTSNLFVSKAYYASNLRKDQIVHPQIANFSDWWVSHFASSIMSSEWTNRVSGKKLFLSRGEWKKPTVQRICVNHADVERVFLSQEGWFVIHPQKYSLLDQISIFSNASGIFGEEGSGMHNSIFLEAGASITTMRGPFNHSAIQSGLCRAKNQVENAIFGVAKSNGVTGRSSNFEIPLTLVENILSNFPRSPRVSGII